MKVLYITTVGSTMCFFKTLIKKMIDNGDTIDIATNEKNSKVPECYKDWGCSIFQISTNRSPFSFGNVKAIFQIKKLVRNNNYDIVHCHTPLAGMATRLACKRLRKKQNTKIVYTAHGFHFYQGSPRKNWLIYYPIEKMCSKWTDLLITITNEDFEIAKKKLKAKNVAYIPGVGIDTNFFKKTLIDKKNKRRELGINENDFVILSVGELNDNKNHKLIIDALSLLTIKNIVYVIAGSGNNFSKLFDYANEKKINLKLLGHRDDINQLYKMSDLYCLPSIREGLNVSLMESLASGVPTICSRIRGNIDMIDAIYLFSPFDPFEASKIIENFVKKDFTYQNSFDIENVESKAIVQTTIKLYKQLREVDND